MKEINAETETRHTGFNIELVGMLVSAHQRIGGTDSGAQEKPGDAGSGAGGGLNT